MQRWMPQLFAAIRANNFAQIYRSFQGLSLDETVEAVSFAGPARVRGALLFKPANFLNFLPGTSTSLQQSTARVDVDDVCNEVLLAWRDPSAIQRSTRNSLQIREAITRVGRLRATASRATMTTELTPYLPAAGNPPRLSRQDIINAAMQIRAEPAAVHAVAEVESSGDGFDGSGRPKILFEAHHFKRRTNGRFDVTHPHLSRAYQRTPAFRQFYRWDQWTRMYEALLLDHMPALESASWGKFQVMGFNHNGWPDALSFARDSFAGEANHLRAFLAFVSDNNLIGALRRNDFTAFTRGYNGEDGIANQYHIRMQNAYNAYRRANH
jgi:hypothetical protein